MNQAKLNRVKGEIARVNAAIKAYEEKVDTNREEGIAAKARGFEYYSGSTGKESGALRRASLDLTRALAEMRKW